MRTLTTPAFLSDLLSHLQPDAPKSIDGATLAKLLPTLTACEAVEGGPYRSSPHDPLHQLDVGVNLAVALFLRKLDIQLPNVDAYLALELEDDSRAQDTVLDAKLFDQLLAQYRRGYVPTVLKENVVPDTQTPAFLALMSALDIRLASLPTHIAQNARWVIERTIRGNADQQMWCMPFFMRDALGSRAATFSSESLAQYALANVCFWTAFIVYDDFWDEDEAAEPRLLPVANLLARHFTNFFVGEVYPNSSFTDFFETMMDKVDAANAWEMKECRLTREANLLHIPDSLPDYGNYDIKFYPAAGHVLGPVAMLLSLGYSLESEEVQHLITYFKHYLIAMQLNDDAHDWKEDLQRGHISTSVALLLRAWREAHPGAQTLNISEDRDELERLFWFRVLEPICTSVLVHAHEARRALASLSTIEDQRPLEQFIIRNEVAAKQALAEYEQSIEFLKELRVSDEELFHSTVFS